MILSVDFGAAKTGVGYQFFGADGALLGARTTAGIVAGPQAGVYFVDADVPNGAVGIYWDCDDADFTATEEIATRLLIEKLNVGETEETVIVIPAPAADMSLCRVYGNLETPDNLPAANVQISFTLVAPNPTKSERLISGRKVTVTTNSDGAIVNSNGDLYVELQRNDLLAPAGTTYRVVCKALSLDKEITLTTDTFDLLSVVSA